MNEYSFFINLQLNEGDIFYRRFKFKNNYGKYCIGFKNTADTLLQISNAFNDFFDKNKTAKDEYFSAYEGFVGNYQEKEKVYIDNIKKPDITNINDNIIIEVLLKNYKDEKRIFLNLMKGDKNEQ